MVCTWEAVSPRREKRSCGRTGGQVTALHILARRQMRCPLAATCHLQCPPCCRLILTLECSRARSITDLFRAFRQDAVRLSHSRQAGGARTLQVFGGDQLTETHWAEDRACAVRYQVHPNLPNLSQLGPADYFPKSESKYFRFEGKPKFVEIL